MGKLIVKQQTSAKTRRKACKIPIEIKKQFLKAIQEQPSIKKTAQRFGINYSTAKTIIHTNKAYFDQKTQKNDPDEYVPNKWALLKTKPKFVRIENRCSYTQIQKSDECSGQSQSMTKTTKIQKIGLVSTIGWNFLKRGLPQ